MRLRRGLLHPVSADSNIRLWMVGRDTYYTDRARSRRWGQITTMN